MTRAELIEAGARAFYEEAYGSQYADQAMRRRLAPHMNAVLDAVEPLIRADERSVMLAARRYERVDLRSKVEALRAEAGRNAHASNEANYETATLEYQAELQAYDAVLALFDGGSDE